MNRLPEARVLIVGEARDVDQLARAFGYRSVVVTGVPEGPQALPGGAPALVIVNTPGARLPTGTVRQLSRLGSPVLIVADPGEVPDPAVKASSDRVQIVMRPVSPAAFRRALGELIPEKGDRLATSDGSATPRPSEAYLRDYARLLAGSPQMLAVRQVVEEVAATTATVLLRGESGVGKDLVARAVHAASPRHNRPFVKVNCAALPAELLESELFGHEKGSFTGAHRRKLGKFEFANSGTIFLDEIGDLARSVQAKILHVLQDLAFARIGGREVIRVDTRVIAATNRDLENALANGEFREDLYYRLNVVEIRVPPLRERREEIATLAATLLARFNHEYHRSVELDAETAALFMQYSWPGNVRELENVIRRLVVLASANQVRDELRARLRSSPGAALEEELRPAPYPATAVLGLKEVARRAAIEAERKALSDVLERVRWKRVEAARILKVSYKTLLKKIDECGLASAKGRGR